MTRKDYIILAEALNLTLARVELDEVNEGQQYPHAMAGVMAVAEELGLALKRDNDRFDREHFLAVVRGERELQSRPPKSQAEKLYLKSQLPS